MYIMDKCREFPCRQQCEEDLRKCVGNTKPLIHRPFLQEGLEGVDVALWHMDNFITYIDAVITVNFLDLVKGYDIRTVYTHEMSGGKHSFNRFHGQVGNQGFGLVIEVKHHVILHSAHIDDMIEQYLP